MKRILMVIMVAVMIAGPIEMDAKRTGGKSRTTVVKKKRSKSGRNGRQSRGTVYICTGSHATKYHSSPYCSGLNRCSGSVVSRTSTAGYSPCLKCH